MEARSPGNPTSGCELLPHLTSHRARSWVIVSKPWLQPVPQRSSASFGIQIRERLLPVDLQPQRLAPDTAGACLIHTPHPCLFRKRYPSHSTPSRNKRDYPVHKRYETNTIDDMSALSTRIISPSILSAHGISDAGCDHDQTVDGPAPTLTYSFGAMDEYVVLSFCSHMIFHLIRFKIKLPGCSDSVQLDIEAALPCSLGIIMISQSHLAASSYLHIF